MSCSFLKNDLRHIFLVLSFFSKEHFWGTENIKTATAEKCQVLSISFSKDMTPDCSSFVCYSWKSLLQDILKCAEG